MKSDKAGGVNVSFSSVCHVVLWFCGSGVLGFWVRPSRLLMRLKTSGGKMLRRSRKRNVLVGQSGAAESSAVSASANHR